MSRTPNGTMTMPTSPLRLASTFTLLAATVLALVGCGGGGATGTATTTPVVVNKQSITVALVDLGTLAPTTSISVGTPAQAQATVLDTTGKPAANQVVTFNITPSGQATITPSVGTALTNDVGVATVQIDPASVTSAGAATVTASVTLGTAPITASTNFSIVLGRQPTISVAVTDPDSGLPRATISAGAPAQVKATVIDAAGKLVANKIVTFSVTPSGQAAITPSAATALTSDAGIATVQIDPASLTAAGVATVTATVTLGSSTINASANFSIVAVQPPKIVLTVTDPDNGLPRSSIKVGNPAIATATVRDTKGAAVVGTIVTFSGTPAQIGFTPATGTAVTDGNGVATVQLDPANLNASGAVTLAATAQVGGLTGAATTNLTIGANTQRQLSVVLTDPASGAARTSISLGNPAVATATVLDISGKAVAQTVVSFSTTPAGQVNITPASGTALTNSFGVASVQIDPASLAASGAATVTATAPVAGATVTGSTSFSIGLPNLDLSGMSTGNGPLSAYGTRSVTVNVTGVPSTTSVVVNFSSLCTATGKASLPASVQTINGVATATYKDNGCGQTDTITAGIAGTTKTASASLVVAAPGTASIQFVSATPTTIVLKGTGGAGLSESSIVVFKVLDNNNLPVANTNVTLDLTTRTGGILLDNSTTAVTKQTDTNGVVQVAVQAGTNPTAVWVNATTGSFNSQSTVLRISTGRPAQDRFSLAVSTHNIEGWNYDGITTTVTAFASDRMGNPVPEGTAVNFIAEGGQIQPGCVTSNGQCNVVFTSANPRPKNEPVVVDRAGVPSPNAAVNSGRATILAYALGEESFIDSNGNNIYDAGEPFNDLGDAYLDSNENGRWDPGEQFIPFGAGGSTCVTGIQNSTGFATSPYAPSKDGSCDGRWGQAHVRQQNLIIMSGSTAFINNALPRPPGDPLATPLVTTFPLGGACQYTVGFYLFDLNRNPMPAGTTVSASNLSTAITSATPGGTPVTDSTAPGGTTISVTIKLADAFCPLTRGAVSFDLNITTPKGLTTTYPIVFTP